MKANRQFAQQVFPILHGARQTHRNFHSGQLSREQLAEHRVSVEAQLAELLSHLPVGGWAADSQNERQSLPQILVGLVHFFNLSRSQTR